MEHEEIKNIENTATTELSGADIPLVVTNDLEIEIVQLREEIEQWKTKYNRLCQETELLRNPIILKEAPLSIPVEKLPTSKE